jgi:hypothetical protein
MGVCSCEHAAIDVAATGMSRAAWSLLAYLSFILIWKDYRPVFAGAHAAVAIGDVWREFCCWLCWRDVPWEGGRRDCGHAHLLVGHSGVDRVGVSVRLGGVLGVRCGGWRW